MYRFTNLSGLCILLAALAGGCSDGSDTVAVPDGHKDAEKQDLCAIPPADIPVNVTGAGIDYVRTPDACFESLVDYPYTPSYVLVDGMRMHYVDAGPVDGEVVLMLHGQPSWSYLYRKMIPVLVDAGYRVIALDHIGMGRSDKPVDPRVHQFEQHVAWLKAFIGTLELSDVTLFVQDWGSLTGLRVAGDRPELFARIVLANGDLPVIPAGLNPFVPPVFEVDDSIPDAFEFFAGRSRDRIEGFQQWIDFAAGTPDLFAADVVQIGTLVDLSPAELRAYDAPFPGLIYRAAIRAFPSMVAGVEDQNAPAWEALGRFGRPFLALAGEADPNLGSERTQNKWIEHVPGSLGQDHRRYEAGHFIQEDVGADMAAQVVDFMRASPIPVAGPFFNLRYCEILLLSATSDAVEADVYNTLGLNDCPQSQWDAIDLDAVADEAGALLASGNGPRYWLLDRITPIDSEASIPVPGFGDVATFGELEMRLVANVTLSSVVSGEVAPYIENEVQRNTIFSFVAGRRVFELESAEGDRYVMQSMSQIVDPQQQLHDLLSLGARLALPDGWAFSTRILQEDLDLTANGLARVITDDLLNTYQKVE